MGTTLLSCVLLNENLFALSLNKVTVMTAKLLGGPLDSPGLVITIMLFLILASTTVDAVLLQLLYGKMRHIMSRDDHKPPSKL